MLKFYPNTSKPRPAFTLIELLIVMGVLVLLAAVTLPSVKELLKDQKSSQAARLVQAYSEGARARAIATGRPVAMIIDRMYVDGSGDLIGNDSSTRLSIGEVFPPYEGDWSGAKATITSQPGSVSPRGTQRATIDFNQAASLWDTALSAPSGMVSEGDIIQFGDSRKSYRVSASPNSDNPAEVIAYDTSGGGAGLLHIDFDNPPYDEESGVFTGEPTIFPATSLKFRIFRKPSKSLVGSIALPRGICIDLSASGVGVSGLDFGSAAIAASTRTDGTDPDREHLPGAYGPIQIVFDPAGRVQDVFYGLTPIVGDLGGRLVARRPAGSTIHLLIGKTEQVVPNPAYLGPAIVPPFDGLASRDDVRYNIFDPTSFWVSINPFSGAITASQVQDQSAFPPLGDGLTDVQRATTRVARSRSLATSGFQRVDP